jgi:predicted outer membrane protein
MKTLSRTVRFVGLCAATLTSACGGQGALDANPWLDADEFASERLVGTPDTAKAGQASQTAPSSQVAALGANDFILVSELNSLAAAQAQMAHLAQLQSTSPMVKEYAEQAATHAALMQLRVQELFYAKGETLTTTLALKDSFHLARLSRRTGAAFDVKYLNYQYGLRLDELDDLHAAAHLSADAEVHLLGSELLARAQSLTALLYRVVAAHGTAADVAGALQGKATPTEGKAQAPDPTEGPAQSPNAVREPVQAPASTQRAPSAL